jgi:histidine triad (HIT) family protein
MDGNPKNCNNSNMTHSNHDENCVFCKIINQEIPAVKVYEDDSVLAFLDIRPVNKGHTLVIPKDHFENIYSVPAELWCRVMLVAQKIAIGIKNAVSADGINIIMNNESAAGQLVFHAHVHVIPRENEDGLVHWPHKSYIDEVETKNIADKIRDVLQA